MGDADRLSVWIENLDGSEECPSCGRGFDKDAAGSDGSGWEDKGGYHYRSGGKTVYGCLTEGCDGEVEVTI